jgi:hypothetical protein
MSEIIEKEEYEIVDGKPVKKTKKAFSTIEDEDVKNSEDNLVNFAGDEL